MSEKNLNSPLRSPLLWLAVTFISLGILNWDSNNQKQNNYTKPSTNQNPATRKHKPSTTSQKPTPVKPKLSIPSYPIKVMPRDGTVKMFTNKEAIAPLSISTPTGSSYLVKLYNNSTNSLTMNIFLRGGGTTEVKVPLGKYTLKYATGGQWYGYEHYFGPNTSYSKAEDIFNFYKTSRGVSGYTLTLYTVSNGNLQTTSINGTNF